MTLIFQLFTNIQRFCIDGKELDSHKRKQKIIDFISQGNIKYELAVEYTKIYKEKSLPEPEWILEILKLFNQGKKTAK